MRALSPETRLPCFARLEGQRYVPRAPSSTHQDLTFPRAIYLARFSFLLKALLRDGTFSFLLRAFFITRWNRDFTMHMLLDDNHGKWMGFICFGALIY